MHHTHKINYTSKTLKHNIQNPFQTNQKENYTKNERIKKKKQQKRRPNCSARQFPAEYFI